MAIAEAFQEFSLAGKAAVVVGAEGAVGRAAVRTLAEAGANVMLASQEPGTAEALKETIKSLKDTGRKFYAQVQSASTRADLSATMDLAVKELGGLDILVNALDVPHYAPVESADDTAFERVIENNFKTVWMSCQEGGRIMLQKGGGVIINISSILAERGVPNAALYCAAKAAVVNFSRALALEWARRGVRVNIIEAGWLEEDNSPAVKDEDFRKNLLKYIPYNRLVKPEELSGALLYLACPAAGFVTGESIAVDGGLLCRV